MKPIIADSIYRTAYENSIEGICYCQLIYQGNDPVDVLFVDANKSFETISGLKNVTGKKTSELFPRGRAKLLRIIREAYENRKNKWWHEEQFFKISGKWGQYSVRFLEDGYFIGFLEDITDRKTIEINLVKSNNLLNATIEATGDGILAVDNKQNAVVYNKKYFELSGLPTDLGNDLDIRTIFSYVLPQVKNPGQMINERDQIIANPQVEIDSIIEAKDGRIYHRVSKPQYLNNEIVGRVICLHDITDLARSHRELQTTLNHLKFHLDNSSLAVIEFDSEIKIVSWSKQARAIFGWDAAEVTGKKYSDFKFIHEGDAGRIDKIIKEILTSKGDNIIICRNHRKDGSVIFCEWHYSVLTDPMGNLLSIWSIAEDISERINNQTALNSANIFNTQVLDGVQSGIIVIDNNLNIKLLNHYIEDLFKVRSGEFLDKNVVTFLHPLLKDEIVNCLTRSFGGEVIRLQIQHPQKTD